MAIAVPSDDAQVGHLPTDWTIVQIGDISDVVRGGSPRPAGDPRYFNGSFIPWLTVAALTNIPPERTVVTETLGGLTKDGSLLSRILEPGTVIIANSGATLGVAKILGIKACANDGIAAILNLSSDIVPQYLVQFINTTTTHLRDVVATGNGQPNLNTGLIASLPVPLPATKKEQIAIAEALTDADAYIESLEQLIAKKWLLKQGTTQELLAGKRRLPGFSGDWESKRLEEVAEIRSGGTPSTHQPQFWDGGVPWCTPTDITGLRGKKYLERTTRTISILGLKSSSAEMVPRNSVVMTSRATIGECAINRVPVTTNQGFKNFIPRTEVDVEFLYYLLLTQKQKFISLCGGSTFLEIGKGQLAAFSVLMPPSRDEQIFISSLLSNMDLEIGTLHDKLVKARDIKQGMMQNLLTGKVRLV